MRLIWTIVALVVVLCLSVSAQTVSFDGTVPIEQRGFYSSFRHLNLIDISDHRGWADQSELGGMLRPSTGGPAFNWRLIDRRFEFAEQGLSRTDFTVSSRSRDGWLGMRLPIAGNRLLMDVQSGVSRWSDRAHMVYDMRVEATPIDAVGVVLCLDSRVEKLDIDGVFWDEAIALTLPFRWNSSGLEAHVRLLDNLAVRAGYRDIGLADRVPGKGDEFASALSGAAEYRYQELSWGRDDGPGISLHARQIRAGGKLNLYYFGTGFGQIPKIKADADWYGAEGRLPIAPRHLKFSLDYLTLAAEIAGHVKSWPFTDPLEDLLGLRRNFIGDADVTLWRLAGEANMQPTPAWHIVTSLDLYRLYPNLHFADWMPSFMVFGVEDMDIYNDNYDRIDFGRLQVNVARKIGRLAIGGHISQLFPIKIRRDTDGISTGGGGAASGGASSSSSHGPRDDGGRSIRVWVGYSL